MFQWALLVVGSVFSLYAVWAAMQPLPQGDPYYV